VELFGDYVLLERIGAGSMGDISLACPRSEGAACPPLVVVKRLHAGLSQSDQMVRRFVHEANVAAALDDPHVMRVYEAGQVGSTLYFVGELIAGASLAELITAARGRREHFPVGVAAAWARDAARGLHALHAAVDADGQPLEAVHRDVSPRNLMVDERGRCRVIDLGLLSSRAQDWQTRTGAVMGSPGYMSPEQVAGLAVAAPADVYALGTILFELLSGERYIPSGPTVVETVRASLTPTPRPAGRARGDVPLALEQVLAQALAISPSARPTARALAELLAPFAADAATSAARAAALFGPVQRERLEHYRFLAGNTSLAPIDEPTLAPTMVFARHTPRPVSRVSSAPEVQMRTAGNPAWLAVGAAALVVAALAWSSSGLLGPAEPRVIAPELTGDPIESEVPAPEPAATADAPAADAPATDTPPIGAIRATPAAPPSPTVRVATAEPGPDPVEVASPAGAPNTSASPAAPPRPRPVTSARGEPPRRSPAPQAVTASPTKAPEDTSDPQIVRARLRTLRTRGLALEARVTPGSEAARELASLLGRLALEAARTDPRQAARAADELEASLRRLEDQVDPR
jgi:serine/threonine-protein kinase